MPKADFESGRYHRAYAKSVGVAKDSVAVQSNAKLGALPTILREAAKYHKGRVHVQLMSAAQACESAVGSDQALKAAERAHMAATDAVQARVRGADSMVADVTAQVALDATTSALRLAKLVSGMAEDAQRHASFVPSPA